MNYDCPNCGESLKWKRMPMRPYPKGEKWYKASGSEFYCPFCDVDLSENRSFFEKLSIFSSSIVVVGIAIFILLINKELIWVLIFPLILEGIFMYYLYKVKLKKWPRWKAKEEKL